MRRFLLCMLLTSIFILNIGYTSYAGEDESEYPDNNPNLNIKTALFVKHVQS